MAGAFFAPFLYGLYYKGTSWIACEFMSFDMLRNPGVLHVKLGILRSPISAGAFCMILGPILVPLISLIIPKRDVGLCRTLSPVMGRR